MKSTRQDLVAGVPAALGLAATGVLATPSLALAEESAVGASILIPKPAEFIPALIAFAIIWAVLAKLVWPQVLGMMEKREAKIRGDLDSAERSKVEAAEKAKSYDQMIAEAHGEAEGIVAQARKDASKERAAMLAKAQGEVADTISKAHGAIEMERHKAAIELSGSVADLSVEIAAKILGNDLSVEEHRRLAEKYLAEVSLRDEQPAKH